MQFFYKIQGLFPYQSSHTQMRKKVLLPQQCSLGEQGLGAESDEEIETSTFNRKTVGYLKTKETINRALRRLGGDSAKLSSVERLKRNKAGALNSSKEVTELTELANEILTQLGNMAVYQETYKQVTQKFDEQKKLVDEASEEAPKVLM